MKIVSSYLIPGLDFKSDDTQRVQRILEEINEASEKAIEDVLVANSVKGDLLCTSRGVADDVRIVVADADKILAVRKHNKLPTGTEQKTLNKFWATLMRTHELYHPEDPNYN